MTDAPTSDPAVWAMAVPVGRKAQQDSASCGCTDTAIGVVVHPMMLSKARPTVTPPPVQRTGMLQMGDAFCFRLILSSLSRRS